MTMNKTHKMMALMIACVCVALLSSAMISAQDRSGGRRGPGGPGFGLPGEGPMGPSEPGLRFISSEMQPGGKVVKGAPYSAEVVTESVQTLGDGTKLTRKSSAMVYRDGEGRTRREQSAAPVGPFATTGDAPKIIFINDPVAGAAITLFPDSKEARKMTMHQRSGGDQHPPGPPPQGARPPGPPPGEMHHPEPTGDEVKTESLGKQTIEGVEAEGTRTTITIPAGKIGNDRAIEIVHERWYSPELQTVVLNRHNDPRWGETTFKLTKVSRSEPAHALFELPSDYTVKEGPPRPPEFGGARKKTQEK